jgi:hypothetical protein
MRRRFGVVGCEDLFSGGIQNQELGSPVVPVDNDVATTFTQPGNDFLRNEGNYQGMMDVFEERGTSCDFCFSGHEV